MTKEDCRANARKCHQVAQHVSDFELRRMLLDLAVQWRELAAQIERVQSGQRAPSPGRSRPATLH
jgi:hypothetical protein